MENLNNENELKTLNKVFSIISFTIIFFLLLFILVTSKQMNLLQKKVESQKEIIEILKKECKPDYTRVPDSVEFLLIHNNLKNGSK